MIDSLHIENFRGFKELHLGQLSKVNLLVGRNSQGKTSVLDALSIIAQPDDGVPITQSGIRRDLPPPSESSDLCFRSIFRNLQPNERPRISIEVDLQPHSIDIIPAWEYSNGRDDDPRLLEPADISQIIVGLRLQYKAGSAPMAVNHVQLSTGRERFGWLERPIRTFLPEKIGSFTIEARNATNAKATAHALTNLIKSNRLNDLLELLRPVAPNIQALHAVAEGDYPVIWVQLRDRTLPVNLLGDGFCRLLLIGTGILSGRSLILADEIDSGLHRSVMADFWINVAKLMRQHHGQLVCVTHNEDMLEAAAEAFAGNPADLSVFRISCDEHGQGTAVHYGRDELMDAFAFGLDPRG